MIRRFVASLSSDELLAAALIVVERRDGVRIDPRETTISMNITEDDNGKFSAEFIVAPKELAS